MTATNKTQTHNYLIHLNSWHCACFEQGVPWDSGKYRVWIHSEMRTWHDGNIKSIEGSLCILLLWWVRSGDFFILLIYYIFLKTGFSMFSTNATQLLQSGFSRSLTTIEKKVFKTLVASSSSFKVSSLSVRVIFLCYRIW